MRDYGELNAEKARQMTPEEKLRMDVDAIMHMLLSLHAWMQELPDAIPDKYDMVSLLWEMHRLVSLKKGG